MSLEEVIDALKNFSFNMMHYREKQMKKANLSYAELFVLLYVMKTGPVKLSEFANILGLSKPTITHVVDVLEQRGLMKRELGTEDRRVVKVTIDEAGKELFKRFELIDEKLRESINEIDELTQKNIVKTLNKLSSCITENLEVE